MRFPALVLPVAVSLVMVAGGCSGSTKSLSPATTIGPSTTLDSATTTVLPLGSPDSTTASTPAAPEAPETPTTPTTPAAATGAPPPSPAAPSAPTSVYGSCDEVRAAGKAPIRRGDPGFTPSLDRDGDGTGCELEG